jgi:hypothetical protein
MARILRLDPDGVSNLTEQHSDVSIFGEIFDPLMPWRYTEKAGRVSKRMRSGTSGKAGYLVDYLRVVNLFPTSVDCEPPK